MKVEELHSRGVSGTVGLHGPRTEVKVGEHSSGGLRVEGRGGNKAALKS